MNKKKDNEIEEQKTPHTHHFTLHPQHEDLYLFI